MICLGILWNSMEKYTKEAVDDISSYGKLIDLFTIDLGDYYEKFVRDIYAQDDIAQWKVDKKLETMFDCSDSRKVSIIFLDIETLEFEYHPLKKRMVYTNLENMKVNIRNKYKKFINNYFFDNVFHVTDDEKEYMSDLAVINCYLNLGLEKIPFSDISDNNKVLRKEYNNGIKE